MKWLTKWFDKNSHKYGSNEDFSTLYIELKLKLSQEPTLDEASIINKQIGLLAEYTQTQGDWKKLDKLNAMLGIEIQRLKIESENS